MSPFRLDFSGLTSKTRQLFHGKIEGVQISLPFLSFAVRPQDLEQKIAREIVVRLADRRVLDGCRCCDDCLEKQLSSLQEVRSMLVDKQVDLANISDGPLYFVIEYMLEAIRQFLTFQERLGQPLQSSRIHILGPRIYARPREDREVYFEALDLLRSHLQGCLVQIRSIADVKLPQIVSLTKDSTWQLGGYVKPHLPDKEDV